MNDETKKIIAGAVALIGIVSAGLIFNPDELQISSQDIFVQVRIKQETPFGQFNDADYLPVTPEQRTQILEILGVDEKDIENIAKARILPWIQSQETQKETPPHELTEAELIKYKH